MVVVRPFLAVPKSRLLATLAKAGIGYAVDPTNADQRFMRPRLRAAMPALEREGLSAHRLALLARRMRRADDALEFYVEDALAELAPGWMSGGAVTIAAKALTSLPAEIVLRLLGRLIDRIGNEGPVELGKLEALHAALADATPGARFRRTLAGALVTRRGGELSIERAPARRGGAPKAP
jgi:tRNA(Ile)-lysidine synthase